MIYTYGPFSGFASYPVVMRSVTQALRDLGLDCTSLDISGGEYKNSHRCLPHDEVARFALGFPPVDLESNVVFALKPEIQMRRLVIEHGMKLVGLHVGDVSEIPTEWKLIMAHEAKIVVPSTWMKWVVEKAGFSNVMVSRHGIEDVYLTSRQEVEVPPGPTRFLHFCSSGVFPERKSTPAVITAFQRLVREERNVCMTLVVSELRKPVKKLLGLLDGQARERVLVKSVPYGCPPETMIELYQWHHALLCPSRSEGFGIQPLEARALGVPVIQTFCTGMRDHLPEGENPRQYGIVPVEHGDLVGAWGDFGLAPEVSEKAIYLAMREVIDTYPAVKEASQRHSSGMRVWSWKEQTKGLAEYLKSIE